MAQGVERITRLVLDRWRNALQRFLIVQNEELIAQVAPEQDFPVALHFVPYFAVPSPFHNYTNILIHAQ